MSLPHVKSKGPTVMSLRSLDGCNGMDTCSSFSFRKLKAINSAKPLSPNRMLLFRARLHMYDLIRTSKSYLYVASNETIVSSNSSTILPGARIHRVCSSCLDLSHLAKISSSHSNWTDERSARPSRCRCPFYYWPRWPVVCDVT